jgi:hypothetical protein
MSPGHSAPSCEPASGVCGALRRANGAGVDLYALPIRPFVVRLFFHRLMLSPDKTGFILIVSDWIELSRQLSSRLDAWRGSQQSRPRQPGLGASDILSEDPTDFRSR